MYPMIAMLKLLREQEGGGVLPEPASFAYDFSNTRRDGLQRLKSTAENEQLLETILGSTFELAKPDNIPPSTNIRLLLRDLNNLEAINKSYKGVYFDPRNEWMIVHWIEAAQGVLNNTKYKTEPSTFLNQVAERSPYNVSTEEATSSRLLERMPDWMGAGHKYDLLTVFSVKHILD